MIRRLSTTRALRTQRKAAGSLEEAAYQRIINAVVEQRLAPGTQLKEERLARIFGVSRTRIRKVLGRLSAEGVVTLEPNRGAFVAAPTVKDARDVFEARRAVESWIVQLLAERGARADLSRLRAFIPAEREAFESKRPGLSRFASDFHLILAELAGNQVMTAILRQLVHRSHLIQSLYGPVPMINLVDDHVQLIGQIAAGKVQESIHAMLDHLQRVEASLDLSRMHDTVPDLAKIL
jgi:DNA-binding GntR family transcriptional regulator